jgi:hypothetical protein
VAEWHGTAKEGEELDKALSEHRQCTFDQQDGHRTATCEAHRMVLDQEFLDRLLFARRIVDKLRNEENEPQRRRPK